MVSIGGIVSVGGSGGGGSGSSSGISSINDQTGPNVTIKGVNGVTVSTPTTNCILLDTASISGQTSFSKISFDFFGITSGQFVHNLSTKDVFVSVRASGIFEEHIIPDRVIFNTPNVVSLIFNRPQTGRVVFFG